jgi:hypothetical protein
MSIKRLTMTLVVVALCVAAAGSFGVEKAWAICPSSVTTSGNVLKDPVTGQIVKGPASGGKLVTDTVTGLTCVYPTINMSASSTSIAYGGSTSISWSVSNAAYGCSGWTSPVSVAGWSPGAFQTSGTLSVGPFYQPADVGLTCDNGNGQVTQNYVHIDVAAPPSGGGGCCTQPPGNPCDQQGTSQLWSQFVGYSGVPAGTPPTVTSGGKFTLYVTFKNTGACTWYGGSFAVKLGAGCPDDNNTWAVSRVPLAIGESVPYLATKTFAIPETAPTVASAQLIGQCWRMVREGVVWFGPYSPQLNIQVNPAMQFGFSSSATWSDTPVTMSWSSSAAGCFVTSSPSTGGSFTGLPGSGSRSILPVGDYTFTANCGGVTSTAKLSVVTSVAVNPVVYGSSTSDLSWEAVTKIRCRSHFVHAASYRKIGGAQVLYASQSIKWCFNTKTDTFAVGPGANPFYRVLNYQVGFPWGFSNWTGSCGGSGDCTGFPAIGGTSQLIWATAHFQSCLNVPFVGQVLCSHHDLTIKTTVFGNGTYQDQVSEG